MANEGGGRGKLGKGVGSVLGAVVTPAQKLTDALDTLRGGAEALIGPFESLADSGKKFVESIGGGDGFKGFVESATAIDTMRASLQQATGQGQKYTEMAVSLQAQMAQLGVTNEEASKAFEALHTGFAEFTLLAPKAQKAIAAQASAFTKLGISVEETTANYNTYMKGLGMSAKEAEKANRNMAKLALSIGVAPKQMAEDFAAAMPTLAKYGKSGVKVFNELAVQSKGTGIEMSKLISIAEGFDTFEDAADKAGRLNAMLGGNLINSIDMLTATESERVSMIRQSMAATGQNWDMLDRFQKKGIATALGISDMTDAMRLFGTEQASLDQLKEKADPAVVAQQNLTKAMQDGVSIAQRFAAAFDSIANVMGTALQPILTELSKFMTGKEGLGAVRGIFESFASGLNKVWDWWRKISPETKGLIKNVATMAIKAIALSFALSQVKNVAGPLMDLLTNPWALIITGVMAVYTHWEDLGKLFKNSAEWLEKIDTKIMSFFAKHKEKWPFLVHVESAYNWLKVKIPYALKIFGEWFDKNKPRIVKFFTDLKESVGGWLGGIWEQFRDNKGMFRGGMEATLKRWAGSLMEVFTDLKSMFMNMVGTLVWAASRIPGMGIDMAKGDAFREAMALKGAGYDVSAEQVYKMQQARGGSPLSMKLREMRMGAADDWRAADTPFYGKETGFLRQHDGGFVRALPGEPARNGEVNRTLQTGEFVASRQMVAQMSQGGSGFSGDLVINLQTPDGKEQITRIALKAVAEASDPKGTKVAIPQLLY